MTKKAARRITRAKCDYSTLEWLCRVAIRDHLDSLRKRRGQGPDESPEDYILFCRSIEGALSPQELDVVRKTMVDSAKLRQAEEAARPQRSSIAQDEMEGLIKQLEAKSA